MIWAIGDLHFDFTGKKPMDIFGNNWADHEEKIIKDWKLKVREDDLVLLPGDISWATRLHEAVYDLKRIEDLPGKKIISKGNHDYWWSSLTKMKNLGFKSIEFLNNNYFEYRGLNICGARGWASKDSAEFSQDDLKIYERELIRLKNSLDMSKGKDIIVMIHYPPFNQDFSPNEFSKLMAQKNVGLCIYGHLHGPGHKYAYEGDLLGVNYRCVSSDFLDFKLEEIDWQER